MAGDQWSEAEMATAVAGQQRRDSLDVGRGGYRGHEPAAVVSRAVLEFLSATPCCGCSMSDIPRINTFIPLVTCRRWHLNIFSCDS